MTCPLKASDLPGGQYFHLCEACNNGWVNGDKNFDHDCGNYKEDGVVRTSGSARAPLPMGLGDRTEAALESVGITKERYVEIKERFGFIPSCGCSKRKEWLNKVGSYVGIS